MKQYLEIVLESLLADHHEPIALGQLDEGGEVDQELGTVHNLRFMWTECQYSLISIIVYTLITSSVLPSV